MHRSRYPEMVSRLLSEYSIIGAVVVLRCVVLDFASVEADVVLAGVVSAGARLME